MASGRVELASVGVQDEFITGQPQVTFFLKNFKRHSKFALDTIDNNFDGNTSFGQVARGTIPRKGHLIKTIYLKVELSVINTADSSNVGYTDSIGHAMIDWADLIIGGQTVERITGEYMEMYSDLYMSDSQQEGLKYTVGKTGTTLGLGPASSTASHTYGKYPRIFLIPLPFYFYRETGLSIPLCALTKHEVEVHVKFKEFDKLIVSDLSIPTNSSGSIIRASLPVEYAFITPEEIAYFQSRPIDYVISQLQVSRTTIDANETEKVARLNFINPVKEMFLVIQSQTTDNNVFDFRNLENVTSPINEHLSTLNLSFNGQDRISEEMCDALYMHYLQPMAHHTRTPTRFFYSYSFALQPERSVPTGQVNMSRIINKLLKITTTSSTKVRDVRIYAVNLNILRVEHGLAGVIFNDNGK